MSVPRVMQLDECREFVRALNRGPAFAVHGTALVVIAAVVAALVWSATTHVYLTVQGRGRVRPIESPQKVYVSISPAMVGRVIETNFEPGDLVRQGAVLLRLDTERLDNEIEKQARMVRSAEIEVATLGSLTQLQVRVYEAELAKSKTALRQAEADTELREAKRKSEIRQIETELTIDRDRVRRLRQLVSQRVVTQQQFIDAMADVHDAEERLHRARLPIAQSAVEMVRRELQLVENDHRLKQAQLAREQVVQRRDLESAERDLADLKLQRREATVRAPIDGIVTTGDVKVGEFVQTRQPVLEIARQQGLRFQILLDTKDAGRLRTGMPARIRFDAFNHHDYGTLAGRVCYISPDSEPSTESGGAPTYVVRIELERDTIGVEARHIRLGLAGTAEIITDRHRLISILAGRIRQTVSLN